QSLAEERGLVRVGQGRVTTVQSRDAWNLLDPLVIRGALAYDDDMALLDNLIVVRRVLAREVDRAAATRLHKRIVVRRVLEREMARAAATRLTDDDLDALAANLEQMEASFDDYERFGDLDLACHEMLVRGWGNALGPGIARPIHTHAGVMRPIAAAQSRSELERT